MPDQNSNDWKAVEWSGGPWEGALLLIDQTLLPLEYRILEIRDVASLWEAIRSLRVRGAPAIGIAAGFGVVLGAREVLSQSEENLEATKQAARSASDYLRTSRPTAVNLFWALDRINRVIDSWTEPDDIGLIGRIWEEAEAIRLEDEAMCRLIGLHGAVLIESGQGVLTHCNAGALATSAHGTALAAIYAAQEMGKTIRVFADETRPLLQGARLTAWELQRRGIAVTLICDNMAAQVMKEGKVQLVIVGADRVAANGDAANKIGTYGLAVLARAHQIPFYVAAPSSTFDLSIADGSAIPIEYRSSAEVAQFAGQPTAPQGVEVYNPAFDVTPASLISGIVTEKGLIAPVNAKSIAEMIPGPGVMPGGSLE